MYAALPLQATDCGDTIQLVRGLTPLIPRLRGEMNMKKRIHEIKIRFSPDELATLNKQVEKPGFPVNSFVGMQSKVLLSGKTLLRIFTS